MRTLVAICLFTIAAVVQAADPALRWEHEQYLVPVTGRNLPGANGSIWSAEWTVRNIGNVPLTLITPRGDEVIPANTVVRPELPPRTGGNDGAFVYVRKASVPNSGMSLRVRDVSGNATDFGAEVMIVNTSQFRPTVQLLDIPTDPRYRATLRVYGSDSFAWPTDVWIQIATDDREIDDRWIPMRPSNEPAPILYPRYPAYAQVDLLTPDIRAAGDRVHVTVWAANWNSLISPPPGIPVWAFVSVTNNATQQVTTITPQP